MKDVPINQRREVYVLGMVQRERLAVMKDVPIVKIEEFASSAEQREICDVARKSSLVVGGNRRYYQVKQ